ncbi:hypothetical protein Pint_17735 [Pistacia integerrima]|uniref:Uncharacterized protein n=1 Tax=Pistacia integerrima TaxID=434235 RepID=A0ACC0Z142_9ROSI|nr:hypothetical protein Pint_17735 [Pistacia integerrima]
MPKITECCTTPLPFCHLCFSIPSNVMFASSPLPFRHLACGRRPRLSSHLPCTILPPLVILCYASFAYCRPALHVIYHYPPQEDPPCPQGGKREIEY